MFRGHERRLGEASHWLIDGNQLDVGVFGQGFERLGRKTHGPHGKVVIDTLDLSAELFDPVGLALAGLVLIDEEDIDLVARLELAKASALRDRFWPGATSFPAWAGSMPIPTTIPKVKPVVIASFLNVGFIVGFLSRPAPVADNDLDFNVLDGLQAL